MEFRRLTREDRPRRGPAGQALPTVGAPDRAVPPQRSYDLLSTILAKGVEEPPSGGRPWVTCGRESRAKVRARGRGREVPEGDELGRLAWSLQPHGYEPRIEDGRMVLENCPFDKVARDHTELVCGLNVEFVGGVADGLGCAGLAVGLEPSPGRCCVSAPADG